MIICRINFKDTKIQDDILAIPILEFIVFTEILQKMNKRQLIQFLSIKFLPNLKWVRQIIFICYLQQYLLNIYLMNDDFYLEWNSNFPKGLLVFAVEIHKFFKPSEIKTCINDQGFRGAVVKKTLSVDGHVKIRQLFL